MHTYAKYSCARWAAWLMQVPQLIQRVELFAGAEVGVELHHRVGAVKVAGEPGIKVSQVTLVASSLTVGRVPRPVAEKGYHFSRYLVRVI